MPLGKLKNKMKLYDRKLKGGEGAVPRHDEGPVLPQVSRAGQVLHKLNIIGWPRFLLADINHWNCQDTIGSYPFQL